MNFKIKLLKIKCSQLKKTVFINLVFAATSNGTQFLQAGRVHHTNMIKYFNIFCYLKPDVCTANVRF
jgi:hypothetical protein